MELISTLEQLKKNIETVEFYLTEGTENEQNQVSNLVKRGSCLLCYEVVKEFRFAPSRFIGYIDNTLNKHNNSHKDGRDTNVEINKILKSQPISDETLRNKYFNYCDSLGLKANNKNHKFWKLKIEDDFSNNESLSGEFPEGKIVERKHKARERNSGVVLLAKKNFKKKYGKLFCEICNFDFEEKYGSLGKDFIEGHHTIAVSEMKEDHKTKPEDIVMLCSNCHKMVHKRRPWLNTTDLKKILKKL